MKEKVLLEQEVQVVTEVQVAHGEGHKVQTLLTGYFQFGHVATQVAPSKN